ncbi:50S ribosomal protein L21 [Candidatus Falkowbacteria bacterium CG10_big_fil_rev_8_21_14_0_10_39_11]|uniref:Large ribosomal subunit protein bL21 n=1 Tax=Candidatus Falkowbacteria bacterium CG10_big_fil_rev_8_21_14_0_10_39_11 TaxID=1974565 RepID=A0A2H0V5Z9_9BACT|nr:MAG: 50S ribosomal protein L21 [Candidatus Falkowbacteria bacterium CG10_big_fil_rev_8_21_14_0_10_39_11]
MSFAVIKTGGKQYKVSEGEQLKIEKIPGEAGDKVSFDQVLLISDATGEKVDLGQPFLDGKTVEAEIIEQARARKINVVKYKAKVRYHKVYGHRQHFTKVRILKIGGAAKAAASKPAIEKSSVDKPAKKTEEKKPVAKKATTTKK